MSRSRRVALVIAALTLGACATVPTRVPLPPEVAADPGRVFIGTGDSGAIRNWKLGKLTELIMN